MVKGSSMSRVILFASEVRYMRKGDTASVAFTRFDSREKKRKQVMSHKREVLQEPELHHYQNLHPLR